MDDKPDCYWFTKIAIGSQKENFNAFFYKFSMDKEFQLKRVKFPIRHLSLDYPPSNNGTPALDLELVRKTISKDKWEHLSFYYNTGKEHRPQLFDNFEKILRDTDQRVFSWLGIENGIKVYFYFQRIRGKWFLIKIEDLSG